MTNGLARCRINVKQVGTTLLRGGMRGRHEARRRVTEARRVWRASVARRRNGESGRIYAAAGRGGKVRRASRS